MVGLPELLRDGDPHQWIEDRGVDHGSSGGAHGSDQ
jgi:hypothetical protein